MQSRFALVLMSIAGAAVLFGIGFALGLGILAPPAERQQHKQIALTTEPTKVARAETSGSRAHDEDRALTPIYPTQPAAPDEAQPAQAKLEPQPAPPQQQQANPQQQAKADAAPKAAEPNETPAPAAAPKNATPVALGGRNACDIDACSRAYRSFRASDCTYQPYSGPRQLCVDPPGRREASRAQDAPARVRVHRAGREVELDNVVREVERITEGRRAADDEDERLVPAGAGRGGWSDDEDQ